MIATSAFQLYFRIESFKTNQPSLEAPMAMVSMAKVDFRVLKHGMDALLV